MPAKPARKTTEPWETCIDCGHPLPVPTDGTATCPQCELSVSVDFLRDRELAQTLAARRLFCRACGGPGSAVVRTDDHGRPVVCLAHGAAPVSGR